MSFQWIKYTIKRTSELRIIIYFHNKNIYFVVITINFATMYKITTLIENCVYLHHLRAEHGLSIFIETPTHKILLDTGASDLFITNARILGIDLRDVDYLILSHGHGDHTGGLHHFLKLNDKAKVICKREILIPKFKNGIENGIKNISTLNLNRFVFINQQTGLVPGVFVFPDIEIINKEDTHFETFFIKPGNINIQDTFDDELALAIVTPYDLSVISSCSHRGITNIMQTIRKSFPDLLCNLVLGGFHIRNADENKFHIIESYFKKDMPNHIGICHCTGIDKFGLFQQQFKQQAFYNNLGNVIKIDE